MVEVFLMPSHARKGGCKVSVAGPSPNEVQFQPFCGLLRLCDQRGVVRLR